MLVLAAIGNLACASLPAVQSIRASRSYVAGTRALDRGETRAAISELERAVAVLPEMSEIHHHLGLAYWFDGRDREAKLELERALALDCGNDAARANLSLLTLRQNLGDPRPPGAGAGAIASERGAEFEERVGEGGSSDGE